MSIIEEFHCILDTSQVPKVSTIEGFQCILDTSAGPQGVHNRGAPLYMCLRTVHCGTVHVYSSSALNSPCCMWLMSLLMYWQWSSTRVCVCVCVVVVHLEWFVWHICGLSSHLCCGPPHPPFPDFRRPQPQAKNTPSFIFMARGLISTQDRIPVNLPARIADEACSAVANWLQQQFLLFSLSTVFFAGYGIGLHCVYGGGNVS